MAWTGNTHRIFTTVADALIREDAGCMALPWLLAQ